MGTDPATHSCPTVLQRSALPRRAGAGGTRHRVEAAAGTGLAQPRRGPQAGAREGATRPARVCVSGRLHFAPRQVQARRLPIGRGDDGGAPSHSPPAWVPFPRGRLAPPLRPCHLPLSAPPPPPPRARELRCRERGRLLRGARPGCCPPHHPAPSGSGARGGRARAGGAGARRRRRRGFRLSGSRSGGGRGRAQMRVSPAGGGGGGGKEAACMRPTGKPRSPGRGFASRGGARRPRRGSWCRALSPREGIF